MGGQADAPGDGTPAAAAAAAAAAGTGSGTGTRAGAAGRGAPDGGPGPADAPGSTAAYNDGGRRKKAKTGPGGSSRGVANLTPEQLAKKRANDREAQRAIRERTKNQIESLERRIRELTSLRPYQELQAVTRAKEALERENADMKRQLAAVIDMLKSMLGPGAASGAVAAASASPAHGAHATVPHHHVSPTPASSASPGAGGLEPEPPAQGWPRSDGEAAGSALPRLQGGYAQQQQQQQQRRRHGNLDAGTERLELAYLLHPDQGGQRLHRMQGVEGALAAGSGPAPSHSHAASHASIDHEADQQQQQQQQPHAVPVRNLPPSYPLDKLLLDFLSERRQRMAAEGLAVEQGRPLERGLPNPPAGGADSHPLVKVLTDILATSPNM